MELNMKKIDLKNNKNMLTIIVTVILLILIAISSVYAISISNNKKTIEETGRTSNK